MLVKKSDMKEHILYNFTHIKLKRAKLLFSNNRIQKGVVFGEWRLARRGYKKNFQSKVPVLYLDRDGS